VRIVSDFHDYYDVVMKLDQEKEPLYLRKKSETALTLKFPENQFGRYGSYSSKYTDSVNNFAAKPYVIGFCGKIYPLLHVSTSIRTDDPNKPWEYVEANCYTIEEVDAFVDQHFKKRERESYRSIAKNSWYWRDQHWSYSYRREALADYFEKMNGAREDYEDFFFEKRVPVFVVDFQKAAKYIPPKGKFGARWEDQSLILNAQLRDLDFVRIFDPYRAFQEINMFMSNMASPEKPIPHVSDRDLLEGKGFDPKWSFRKPPEEKK